MIAVSYHENMDVLQEAKLASSGPFDTSEWFKFLPDDPENRKLLGLASGDGGLVALPFIEKGRHRLDALTNWYAFSWRPLASEGADQSALLTSLARDLRHRVRRVVMAPLPDEDGSATRLEQAFRKAGWFVHRTRCDSNHILPIGGRSFAEYLTSRPGMLRTTIARKAKKLSIEIDNIFHEDTWDIYQRIYNESWKPEEGDPEFLKDFARRESTAGHLRLGIASYNGEPVAVQFWTVENGAAYIHKLAHLPESKHLSAGTILTAALLEHVIDRDRVQLVDFGTGNDRYKADWMEDIRPRFQLDCHNPARVACWPHIARALFRRVASRKPAG